MISFYNIYLFLILYPSVFILILVTITLSIVSSFFAPDSFTRKIHRICAKAIAAIIPLKIRIQGIENLKQGHSYVIVTNHKSNLDAVVIASSLNIDMLWVMKAELLRIPIFGYFCKRIGSIAVNRRDHNDSVKRINEAKKRMHKDSSILFFSEGTRHVGEGLGAFKKGAFHFALDMRLPILPISITGSDTAMPANSIFVRPGKVTVKISPEIAIGNYGDHDIDALLEVTRDAVARGVGHSF